MWGEIIGAIAITALGIGAVWFNLLGTPRLSQALGMVWLAIGVGWGVSIEFRLDMQDRCRMRSDGLMLCTPPASMKAAGGSDAPIHRLDR